MKFSLVITTALVAVSAHVQAADWRVSGFQDKDWMLYSVPDISRRPDGLVRVWTQTLNGKALAQDADHAVANKVDHTYIENVAGRISAHYIPPLEHVLSKLSDDARLDVISAEEIADEQLEKPTSMLLIELDCSEKRYRMLSGYRTIPGQKEPHQMNGTTTWDYAPPETNAASLLKLICDPALSAPDNTPMRAKQSDTPKFPSSAPQK